MRRNSILMMVVGLILTALPAGAQTRTTQPLNAEGGFAERHRSQELPSVMLGMQASPWSWATPEPFGWCGTVCIVPEHSTWRRVRVWRVGPPRRTTVVIGVQLWP